MQKIKTYDELQKIINEANSEDIVIVKLGAEWCGPCKQLEKNISTIENEGVTDIHFYDVDVSDSEDIAEQFNITNIPVMLFFKGGLLINRTIGAINAHMIKNKIEETKLK